MKALEHWLPPEGAGDAVACLATTFTLETDFFDEDCVSRFLGLSGGDVRPGDKASPAQLIEAEEKLSEARVVVVADRSGVSGVRNLRWDLLPAVVPGGLLHAKTALLIWQNAMRFIIGSANLTSAGYRRQIETVVAFDVTTATDLPREVSTELIAELLDIVRRHTPGDAEERGPKRRALDVLGLAVARFESARPRQTNVRIALAPSGQRNRTGEVVSALSSLPKVWRGNQPYALDALSPFWDDKPDMLGATAILDKLSTRNNETRRARFTVSTENVLSETVVRAPTFLRDVKRRGIATVVHALKREKDDERLLHAKVLTYKGPDTVATMVGSSNLTAKGLGLVAQSHREINLWFACEFGSKEATQLLSLVPVGDVVDDTLNWRPDDNEEDEPSGAVLPPGFLDATLVKSEDDFAVRLRFDRRYLPERWVVRTPGASGSSLDSDAVQVEEALLEISSSALPSLLEVDWWENGERCQQTWPVNVADPSSLPPPEDLRDLPVDLLLAVLASTRPLPEALEYELSQRKEGQSATVDELDALKRFDPNGLLLHRVRRLSRSLWGLEQRLSRPAASLEAVDWRLNGPIGVAAVATGLATEAETGSLTPTEAQFMLGELALSLRRVNWKEATARVDQSAVAALLTEVTTLVRTQCERVRQLGSTSGSVDTYVDDALSFGAPDD